MRADPEPGDEVECKPSAGLGGWRKGRLVEWGDGYVRVKVAGVEHEIPRSRVRALGAPSRPPPRPVARAAPRAEPITVNASAGILSAVPKPPPPIRSAAYLDFIRIRPCCSCGRHGPSDPHHFGPRGAGQKTDDYRVVPLCRTCHDRFHDKRTLPGCADVAATREFLYSTQVRLLIEFIEWRL